MKTTKSSNMILSGNILTALLSLAVPIIINSMLQTMYNLTDTYWLGRVGTAPMAAITLVTPIQNIIINFGLGITTAGSILISQYVGAGHKDDSKIMANQIFVCALIFSLICTIVCFASTPKIVRWLGAEDEIFVQSSTYLRIVILDMPFLFMINIYTAVNQAQGDSLKPMYLNFLGIIINLILDPLFLMSFNWSTAGAALATLIAKIPCAAIAFISLLSKDKAINLDIRYMKPDINKIADIIRIGLPSALGSSTMQLGFLLMSRNVFKYGEIAMAAYGIGNKVNGLITMPSNAVGSAVGTIVGQNMGAGQTKRAENTYITARLLSCIFLFVGGMTLSREFISRAVVGILSKDSEVIRLGSDFLSIMAICCWTNGVYNSTMGLFQGTGNTLIVMVVDASRLWVFRFLSLYICENVFHMGVRSIWFCVVISNASSAFILWLLYKSGIWKKNKVKFY